MTNTQSTDGLSGRSYQYDAFGNEKNPSGNDMNPFRYCGEYFDKETETYYLRARYYDPKLGRFLCEDPIGDGLNWYTYCNSNPVMYIDPLGLDAIWLQYEEGADLGSGITAGHTGLLIQDEDGNWWLFYFGADDASQYRDNPSLVFEDVSSYVDCYNLGQGIDLQNEKDFSVLYNFFFSKGEDYYKNSGHNLLPYDGLSGMIYFEGDFTKSLSAAQKIYDDYLIGNGMEYQLFNNNCMIVSIDLLLKGTFTNFDSEYKLALDLARTSFFPNDSYKAMKQFSQYIDSFNQKSWWGKLWTKSSENPWRYLRLQ